MPGTYSYITFAQLKTQLLARLDDAGAVYWLNAGTYNEASMLLIEALRTWQAYSAYWRDRGHVNGITPSQVFWDLPSTLLDASSSLMLQYTVTDQDLVAMIQYHLIEPVTGSSWTGSDQFTLADLTNALQNRRNQLLEDTGLVATHSTINLTVSPPSGRVPLSDSIIDVRRVAWRAVAPSTAVIPLWSADEWAFSAFHPDWNLNAETPSAHSVIGPPPLTLQLSPVPIASGQLELITVNAGADLDPTTGVVLGVPDNFSWAVKWGALSDLLSKRGQAFDPLRQQYCEQRWQQAEEIIRISPCVLTAAVNEKMAFVQPVGDLDAFNTTWEETDGFPAAVGTAGFNLICLAPPPDNTQPYSITLDVVRNAVIPTADASQIQLGREEVDVILDYAVHLASFKMGGQEFLSTLPLFQNFVKHAAVYNDRLRGSSVYASTMQAETWGETKVRPRRESDVQLSV